MNLKTEYNMVSLGQLFRLGIFQSKLSTMGIEPPYRDGQSVLYLSGSISFFLPIKYTSVRNPWYRLAILIGWREFTLNHPNYEELILPHYIEVMDERMKEIQKEIKGRIEGRTNE